MPFDRVLQACASASRSRRTDHNLAELLDERGDTAEAEQLYRRAADLGDRVAIINLTSLHAERGEIAQTEQLHRGGAELGL